ncbi:MAG: acetylglutamate kinase [Pseudomonadota bacterium]|nr:acetylglutamate kinase [Pseudomonadota bacterium]
MPKVSKNSPNNSHVKARILSEALPFLRRYWGETIVVKYGGHAMGNDELSKQFANDIVLLRQVGIHPVVVHGGGPQIGETLERMKIKSSFIDGLRVTDSETVEVVEMVLAGTINKKISASINDAGGLAVGISGKDGNLIKASKIQRTKRDPDSNIERILDLGFVGEPDEINIEALEAFRKTNITPVIAPIGSGRNGETFNINADTVAGAVAAALGAKRLLLLTDVMGILDSKNNLIEKIDSITAAKLIRNQTISGGMIPKVETCLKAVKGGVDAAVILDGRVSHSILLELFTDHGVGTLISNC